MCESIIGVSGNARASPVPMGFASLNPSYGLRRFARPRVIAKGLSDTDIDRIIEEERDAVQPRLG